MSFVLSSIILYLNNFKVLYICLYVLKKMLKIPPIQKRERKWLQRSESTMYFYKKKYTEMDAMSMNLLTVPLHISKNDELYSYRYARDTRTFSIGTNTSYTEYNNVTLFKFKHGFIILLIGNKIIYYCLHFNNIIELIIQSHINNPIVLLDGIAVGLENFPSE